LLQQRALAEQVLVRRIGADRRQAHRPGGTCLDQCRAHGIDHPPCFGKARLWVELGWRQDEDTLGAFEG